MVKIRIHTDREGAWSDADRMLLCLDTGAWRSERPSLDPKKCNYCGICALHCPTQCYLDRGDHFQPNFDFCKGCGICAKECPREAIAMVPEGDEQNL
jgi:2-oxoacid:acceptor oxidoreductase delta subunit (pyruvate/2-ketoisovalerate family)